MIPFAQAQSQFRTGDLLLFRGSRFWFSRLIRLRTASVYTHVGVLLKIQVDGFQVWAVLEATEPGGVRLYPLQRYLRELDEQQVSVDWFQIVDPAIDRDKLAAYCLRQWGARYAPWWQFLVSWGWLSRAWLANKGLIGDVDAERFFCSELAAGMFRAAGYRPDLDKDAWRSAPGDIAMYPCLQRRGELRP